MIRRSAYRFGRVVLDGDARQLLVDGTEIHLSPKAFELLIFLIRNRPRAVSKQSCRSGCGPGRSSRTTDLAGLVAEIRRALDDSARTAAFVRTMHRFGYRFVGDVVETDTAVRARA